MESEKLQSNDLIRLTAEIASAYVANHRVALNEITGLISSIHTSLGSLETDATTVSAKVEKLMPAVPIKKSITREYLICLEDGKHFKSMKRHLATKFGMTPGDYRAKWGLAPDYPMVAEGYSAKRSELALSLGLGRKKNEVVVESVPKSGRSRKGASTKAKAS